MVNEWLFEVPESLEGERIDRALVALLGGVLASGIVPSRSAIQRWIREGRLRVNGVPCTVPSAIVKKGMWLHLEAAPPPPSYAIPEPIPICTLFVDEDVVVVNKEAGMVVHPGAGHHSGTLVNALLYHFGPLPHAGSPDASGEGENDGDGEECEEEMACLAPPNHLARVRPGIVHRLDRGTSGVMVVARSELAWRNLVAQFAAHSIERTYLAIVLGTPPQSMHIQTFYGRHPKDRKRFTGRLRSGKIAITHVERIETFDGASLVRCRLETGRTHQVRVHLSEAGFPLLGDPIYGKTPSDPRLRKIAIQLGRQALHAATLAFHHPRSGECLRFEAPLPTDLEAVLSALRSG
ncbi:MAG: RluA family pseudouridine synthase [Sandaracinaceae bacterium]|nr:RluA family pseudouridine synthase [Sandaracinaceae bacterium]